MTDQDHPALRPWRDAMKRQERAAQLTAFAGIAAYAIMGITVTAATVAMLYWRHPIPPAKCANCGQPMTAEARP